MTEDSGWPPAEPDEAQAEVQPAPDAEAPAEPVTPVPDVAADPQQVADEAAAAEPEPPPARPLPDPDWLLDLRGQLGEHSALLAFAEDVQRRLRNAGW